MFAVINAVNDYVFDGVEDLQNSLLHQENLPKDEVLKVLALRIILAIQYLKHLRAFPITLFSPLTRPAINSCNTSNLL